MHPYLKSACRTIEMEADAVRQQSETLDEAFILACDLILNCQGRVVVTGMGKSGHIGNKIAATLASTGTPAFFVHPGEASHGDLGMITRGDVVIALSNSGETSEVTTLLPLLKRLAVPLISMTGNADSTLASFSDAHLLIRVHQEACPLDLAPTSSTTATLVVGDALAIALLEARGFSAEDFAFSHPGGSLGRRLLLKVNDLMHTGERMPLVDSGTALQAALLEISRKGLGMTAIIDPQGKLTGVYTDGDLRRTLDQGLDIRSVIVNDVMTPDPVTVMPEQLAAEAVDIMQQKKITSLLVVEQDKPVGVLHMHDLLRAGVI
ncbi:KpsF/GutQ family sugar-phosphate isomerase [Oceanospirillum sediminis]|uniref:Arabinose 5-phosphate isomerase n=1 Tax=Oceanospirillum sediminis TaxID=2760088 RepID=A0A839IL86_9GAMM|nr:KpsF/GutQ family sugar-phosphate isomerase [Oceanospirillum sediminis]MBB1485718.1 KpsF/GutQ family sugar-phosphate isomerase [Oceanospirillum sediminis]